jgi:hypothetical protein
MEVTSPAIDVVPAASQPLKIVVSPAGQFAALKALVAQCVPMLQNPEQFALQRRRELAQRLAQAICPCRDPQEPDAHDPEDLGSQDASDTWLEEDA